MAGRYGRLGILSSSEKEAALRSEEEPPVLKSPERKLLELRRISDCPRTKQGGARKTADNLGLGVQEQRPQLAESIEGAPPESSSLTATEKARECDVLKCGSSGMISCDGAKDGVEGSKMESAEYPTSPRSDDYIDHGTGCLSCGADDDHANLLLCEACNDEYHTYCLDPPLRSVPEGDFFCDNCKPFHSHAQADDGLNDSVGVLSPAFTSRFGEIIWAAGGVGFGWWPACIYDPRLTVGAARSLAKNNLGKKHLVYFFECHDAPFTVLGNSKLISWEDGILEEYDLGRTARASGKNKSECHLVDLCP
uniref:PHD-type domain-containing protein n=1 Tax=Odontella aurita TaxID=265563 RepID=A0A7S4JZN6_9STRA|mmetsp:Transcript_58024/g.173178  ORF Transcript_58024/g.173178 Transcript_58024/m.173178 type:complete len:308 (+) Transcript_58024:22-945(+)